MLQQGGIVFELSRLNQKWHGHDRYGENEITFIWQLSGSIATAAVKIDNGTNEWQRWTTIWVKIYYVILACERATFDVMNMQVFIYTQGAQYV